MDTNTAKPGKCLSLGFRKFDPRFPNHGFEQRMDTVYSAYDAKLTISGEPIKFLLDQTGKDEFSQSHFKFLGRWIGAELDETQVKLRVENQFLGLMQRIDKLTINGLMKLWMYQFFVLSKLAWPFLIHDFNIWYAMKLQQNANAYLKRWAGVLKSVDEGLLYRPKKYLGLGLTSMTSHLRRMQVIKCHLCKYSTDEDVRALY